MEQGLQDAIGCSVEICGGMTVLTAVFWTWDWGTHEPPNHRTAEIFEAAPVMTEPCPIGSAVGKGEMEGVRESEVHLHVASEEKEEEQR